MIKVIAVGKIKDKNLTSLITDYQSRISHFHNINIEEVADVPATKDQNHSKNSEGEEILKKIKKTDYVVLLDLQGTALDSPALSDKLADWNMRYSETVFIIGGSDGVSEQVKKRADFVWQLSKLTFPHQLTRLILLEQLYRSYKIINNQAYHK